MRYRWPKEVPILEADDFCRDQFVDRSGRACLSWRVATTFSHHHYDAVVHQLFRAAEMLGATGSYPSLVAYNDNRANPKSLVARIWNRAMAKLGYTVGNPEAKRLKK